MYGTTELGGSEGGWSNIPNHTQRRADGLIQFTRIEHGSKRWRRIPFCRTAPGHQWELLRAAHSGGGLIDWGTVFTFSATFAAVSASLVTTTVPVGASTGTVQVVTPSGALLSNAPFRVLP